MFGKNTKEEEKKLDLIASHNPELRLRVNAIKTLNQNAKQKIISAIFDCLIGVIWGVSNLFSVPKDIYDQIMPLLLSAFYFYFSYREYKSSIEYKEEARDESDIVFERFNYR